MDMEKLVSLCKRRGFIFQSSEIYGGIGGFWDYGPLGVELKRNVKEAWWQDMVPQPAAGAGRARDPDGRAGLRHHHEPEGVGGERARGRVRGSDARVSRLWAFRSRRSVVGDAGHQL